MFNRFEVVTVLVQILARFRTETLIKGPGIGLHPSIVKGIEKAFKTQFVTYPDRFGNERIGSAASLRSHRPDIENPDQTINNIVYVGIETLQTKTGQGRSKGSGTNAAKLSSFRGRQYGDEVDPKSLKFEVVVKGKNTFIVPKKK